MPEYWGKPSPYTEGTAFLGTPTNHEEVGSCTAHARDNEACTKQQQPCMACLMPALHCQSGGVLSSAPQSRL